MLPPLIAALVCSFCWGSAWFFSGRASRQAGSLRALFVFQLLGVAPLLMLFPARPAVATAPPWLAFLGLAALCSVCMGFFFQAMRVGNLALVTPLSQSAPVVTAVLSLVLLGETMAWLQGPAILLVAAGVVLLAVAPGQGSHRLFAGAPQAVVAAGGTGLYLLLCATTARTAGWYWTSLGIRLGMVLLLSPVMLGQETRSWQTFPAAFWRDAAVAAVLDVAAFTLYNYSVTQAELWYVAAIVSSQSLVTVVLAAVFLRERLTFRQWLGLALVLVGLIGLQAWHG